MTKQAALLTGAEFSLTEAVAELGRRLQVGLELAERGFRWLDDHEAEIEDFLTKSKQHLSGHYSYLMKLFDPGTSVTLAFAIEASDRWAKGQEDEALGGVLANWLLEPGLLDQTRQALAKSRLPQAAERQILAGLDFLEKQDYEAAVPLLIVPLEGIFWHIAEENGIVERGPDGKPRLVAPPKKKLHSVEALFDESGLKLDSRFERFLKGLTYGGTGNSYRHGTARGGHQLRALCLFASLLGALELRGQINAKAAVRAARNRAMDERASHSAA